MLWQRVQNKIMSHQRLPSFIWFVADASDNNGCYGKESKTKLCRINDYHRSFGLWLMHRTIMVVMAKSPKQNYVASTTTIVHCRVKLNSREKKSPHSSNADVVVEQAAEKRDCEQQAAWS